MCENKNPSEGDVVLGVSVFVLGCKGEFMSPLINMLSMFKLQSTLPQALQCLLPFTNTGL